jgi:hypothetical protein
MQPPITWAVFDGERGVSEPAPRWRNTLLTMKPDLEGWGIPRRRTRYFAVRCFLWLELLRACVGYAGQSEDFLFQTNEAGAVIVQYVGAGGGVAVPPVWEGLPVVEIGSRAFADAVGLKSLALPDSVVSIGEAAFSGCTGLTNLVLGAGATRIGPSAFYRCSNLPGLALPVGLTKIADHAFTGCAGLTNLVLPDTVVAVDPYAFAGCARLARLSLGAGVTVLGEYAFYGCGHLSDLILPDGLASVGERAFLDCSSLLVIFLPDSVTNVASGAFSGCVWLAAATIGSGLQTLGDNAFNGCVSLAEFYVDVRNPAFIASDGLLYNHQKTVLVQYPLARAGAFTVPDGVVNIGNYAFCGATGLTALTLPNSVKAIGSYAFYGCVGLTNAVISRNVARLGARAFGYCAALTAVFFQGDAPELSGDSVFWGANQATVFYETQTQGWGGGFGGRPTAEWYDPLEFEYQITSNGLAITKYTGRDASVEVPPAIRGIPVTRVARQAFLGNARLARVVLPDSITRVGDAAFMLCPVLTNITWPGQLTMIGEYAFSDCRSLQRLVLPDSVTTLGDGAFYRCAALQSAVLPRGLSAMGRSAFADCLGLASVIVPEGAASLGSRAFSDCALLASIALPASLVEMGSAPFYNCVGLTNIAVDPLNPNYRSQDGVLFDQRQRALLAFPAGRAGDYQVPEGTDRIGYAAFYNCAALTRLALPAGLTKIDYQAFYGCASLESVVLPASLAGIDGFAFSGCAALTGLYFEGNAPALSGGYVFFNAKQAVVYYIPGTAGWKPTLGGRPTAVWGQRYDDWAVASGLAAQYPGAGGQADDPDHDGLSNVQEMAAGTDPTSAASVLAFEREARPAALIDEDKTPVDAHRIALYFQTVPGKNYGVLSSSTLNGPWNTLTNLTATTTQRRVVLDQPAGNAFYRVMVR